MRLTFPLVLAAAVLSGCGGSDDGGADDPATSPSPSSTAVSETAAATAFASAEELRTAVLDAEPDLTCKPARVVLGGEGPNIFYDQGRVNGADECAAPGQGRVFLSFWDDEEDMQMALDANLSDYKAAGLPVLAGSNWAVTGDDYDLGPLQEALGGELLA